MYADLNWLVLSNKHLTSNTGGGGGGEIKVGPNFVLGSRYAKRAIKKVLDANSKRYFLQHVQH